MERMKKEDDIKPTSGPQKELVTNVVIGGKKYLVLTEDLGVEKHLITTRVYLGGEIISSRKIDYKNILNDQDFDKNLGELMLRQHEMVVDILKTEKTKGKKTLSDYLYEVETLLQRKNFKDALKLLTTGLEQLPDEPFLLSYYGCLEAILNKNYAYGIETCSKAIEILKEKTPFGQEFFYPILFLNLGRTYLAAGNKKEAIEAFYGGLAFDYENKNLLREIKKLGMRRKPAMNFLPRSHPINRYIGRILHKLKGT
jgi:tetratricopeptide (TPR) repeat protein